MLSNRWIDCIELISNWVVLFTCGEWKDDWKLKEDLRLFLLLTFSVKSFSTFGLARDSFIHFPFHCQSHGTRFHDFNVLNFFFLRSTRSPSYFLSPLNMSDIVNPSHPSTEANHQQTVEKTIQKTHYLFLCMSGTTKKHDSVFHFAFSSFRLLFLKYVNKW